MKSQESVNASAGQAAHGESTQEVGKSSTGASQALAAVGGGAPVSQGMAFRMNSAVGNSYVQGLARGGGDGDAEAVGGYAMRNAGKASGEAAPPEGPTPDLASENGLESDGSGPAPQVDLGPSQPAQAAGPGAPGGAKEPTAPTAKGPAAGGQDETANTAGEEATTPQVQPNAPSTGSATGQTAPTPPAPTLTSRTLLSAPSGAADTRTTVAVGESVEFTGSVAGTWKASSGTPATGASGTTFTWKAGASAGSATITLTVGSQVATMAMTVVAPSGFAGTKASEHTYAAGTQGAGMVIDLVLNPTTVSFGNIEWLEQPGPASAVTGYFTKFPAASIYHNPNANWLPINSSNSGINDTAAFSGWGSPWTAGGWTWSIPNKYRLQGGSGGGTVFHTSSQVFTLEGAPNAGRSTVSKFGLSTTRSP